MEIPIKVSRTFIKLVVIVVYIMFQTFGRQSIKMEGWTFWNIQSVSKKQVWRHRLDTENLTLIAWINAATQKHHTRDNSVTTQSYNEHYTQNIALHLLNSLLWIQRGILYSGQVSDLSWWYKKIQKYFLIKVQT